ncbi:MAG TPA: M56 family metallopeptidase [Allosphingosinicella sp.]|nr:M56 family metallopeptidase [Allosphingosinicella sp.]
MTASPFAAGAAELELALRATLLIGAAWAAAAMLRKAGASAATRHMAWLLGFAALLALPLFWWLTPPLPLPVLRPEAPVAAAAALQSPAIAAPDMMSGSPGWGNWLLVAYLLGTIAMLLRFAICRRMVSGLWRDAEPATDAAWQAVLSSVSREMRPSRPVELRIARGPAMPMTWGTLAPRVLLPAEACSWSPERRRLVLLHELAHVARRDSLSRSAASLACALYWFHPGAWLAARQMRMEQEFAADDRVLAAGATARTYAASLLDLARRLAGSARPNHAAAMAGMCQLERRLVSITAPAHRDRPGPAFLSASAAIATLVTLAVAAGVLVRPLSMLPDPLRMETDSFATRADTVSDEGRSESEALAPQRSNPVPRGEDRARNLHDGFEEPGAALPPSQAEARALEAGGQQVEPAALAYPTESFQGTPAAPHQLASYGPQLPQPLAEEQETDPRIPAALRRGNAGRSASQSNRPAASRSRAGSVLRILPRVILESSGILPPT